MERIGVTNVSLLLNIFLVGISYMSRSFKGTGHIRDMYEICTEYIRDVGDTGTEKT